jgi:hypothetical protein
MTVKFSKSSLIILIVGVVALGAIIFGMVSTQQAQQRSELEKKLIEAQLKLATIKTEDLAIQKELLTADRDEYTTRIAVAKHKLTDPIDDIAATDEILKSSHEYEVDIIHLNCGGMAINTLEGNTFTALPFNIQAEGKLTNISAFIRNLKVVFPTSTIQSYQLGIGCIKPESTPTTPPEDFADTSVNFQITIYNYIGDKNVER